ncbi:hypothetical protein GCM10022235_43620 [Kribbella ginsengisoli]|uniref:Uncharacterized protein n=1 Tax=Kribbella ginsengisoli TaxID=363865 RepID=A0ABP6XT43_9ACTN
MQAATSARRKWRGNNLKQFRQRGSPSSSGGFQWSGTQVDGDTEVHRPPDPRSSGTDGVNTVKQTVP